MQRLKLSFLLSLSILLMGLLSGCATVSEAQRQQPVVYKGDELNQEHKKLMQQYALAVNKTLHRMVTRGVVRYPTEAYYRKQQGLVELDVIVYAGYPEVKSTYQEGPDFFVQAAEIMMTNAAYKVSVPDELRSKNFAFTISVQFKTEADGGYILTSLN